MQEYRLFFLNKQLLGCYDYWEEGEYAADEQPPLDLFKNISLKIESNLAMANAYEQFTSKHAGVPLDKKKEAYALILIRSMESETEAKANAKLKLLTNKEVAEIFNYYTLEAKPLTVERK